MKRLKQDQRWPDAHERLKKLYAERVPDGMTQEQFGEKYEIGNQGMVWQYLNGWSPLNVEAAAKFAKGLNCTIYDISPAMAKMLRSSILPVLGRAAMIALLLAIHFVSPSHAPYSGDFAAAQPGCVLCQIVKSICRHIAEAVRFLTDKCHSQVSA